MMAARRCKNSPDTFWCLYWEKNSGFLRLWQMGTNWKLCRKCFGMAKATWTNHVPLNRYVEAVDLLSKDNDEVQEEQCLLVLQECEES